MPYLELPLARSFRLSFFRVALPAVPKTERIELPGDIERGNSVAIKFDLLATMHTRQTGCYASPDRCGQLLYIVQDQCICNSHPNSLFTAINCPGQRVVRRVKLLDPGLLLDHLRSVETQSRLPSHDDVA